MALAMAKIVFEVIAVVLEGIVAFVLGFPAGACRAHAEGHAVVGDGITGAKGIVIEQFAGLFVGDGDYRTFPSFSSCILLLPDGSHFYWLFGRPRKTKLTGGSAFSHAALAEMLP
jgi:hypothetical protein